MKATRHYFAVFALLGAGALCAVLASWQWQRGQSKAEIHERMSQTDDPIGGWRSLSGPGQDYRRFELSGRYRSETQFVLTHRPRRQQSGYTVLTPFEIAASGQLVLVDRGWISGRLMASLAGIDESFPGLANFSDAAQAGEAVEEGRAAKAFRPQDSAAPSLVTITGLAAPFTEGYRIGRNQMRSFGIGGSVLYPMVYRDPGDIERALGAELATRLLVLDPQQPGSLGYVAPMQSMTPGKHYSYAVQWLIFAILQWSAAAVYCYRLRRAAHRQ